MFFFFSFSETTTYKNEKEKHKVIYLCTNPFNHTVKLLLFKFLIPVWQTVGQLSPAEVPIELWAKKKTLSQERLFSEMNKNIVMMMIGWCLSSEDLVGQEKC